MKSILKTVATGLVMAAATLFTATPAKAQFGIGGNLGINNYFQFGYRAVGIGVTGHYIQSEKIRIGASLNYMIPKTSSDGKYTTSALNLNLNGHYTFVGDLEDGGFRMYGILGAAFNYISDEGISDIYSSGNLGLGFEFAPSETGISYFAEPILTLGSGNSMTGATAPTYPGMFAGVRFTFGD